MPARRMPALLMTSLLAAAGDAWADRAAVIVQGGDSHFPAAVRNDAIAAVGGALSQEGFDVMPATEAARRLAGTRCTGPDCAERARQRLGVDLVATVALWAAGADRNVPANVLVSLVVPNAPPFRGQSEVGAGELRAALVVALAMARSRQAMGPGPWLRVEGDPRGAVVVVDGTDRGVLPFEGRIDPGTRSVVVRLTGYRTEEHRVVIPAEAEDPVVLEVHLSPSPPSPPSPAPPPHQPQPTEPPAAVEPATNRPLVGPLVLGIVGLAGVGLAVGALLAGDCETESAGGECLVGDLPNEAALIGYGLAGIGAMTAGLLWRLLGGGTERSEPTVVLAPTSVWLRGDL
ncbi:MAG: PEGA domain-containing protein [Deltaproteobacteria bacterium]|nr:PEGA domain-containing protein [Deltaproteobacteria bacterium]